MIVVASSVGWATKILARDVVERVVLGSTNIEAAGEASPPSKILTGPASSGGWSARPGDSVSIVLRTGRPE